MMTVDGLFIFFGGKRDERMKDGREMELDQFFFCIERVPNRATPTSRQPLCPPQSSDVYSDEMPLVLSLPGDSIRNHGL